MTSPVQNKQIVGQGLARLTSAYITKPNCRAWLAAILQQEQELEDAIWGVMNARILAMATKYSQTSTSGPTSNIVFDTLGALVGVARGGLSDSLYKPLIYLKIAVNKATGCTTDWSGFAAILQPFSPNPIEYVDGHAAFEFGVWNIQQLAPVTVAGALAKAVPNGVRGIFFFTTWPDIGTDVEFGSVYDSTAGQSGFGSTHDVTAGGVWAAALEMT